MTQQEKVFQLRNLIKEQLSPLINADYYLFDLPYYENIGDTLIWQGEMDFLNSLPYHCLGVCSKETWSQDVLNVKDDDVILLQGGGNFGDLYVPHQDFRKEIVKHYPNNRIIVLPQTVSYNNMLNLRNDAAVFRAHKNLTICCRDTFSYKLLSQYGMRDQLLLLPDMAFCIDTPYVLEPHVQRLNGKNLLAKRVDGELVKRNNYDALMKAYKPYDVRDWPTYEETLACVQAMRDKLATKDRDADKYANEVFRPELLALGTSFLSAYGIVVTTRLHIAILSVLLGKRVVILDNKYGKLGDFYNSWLKDTELVSLNRPCSIKMSIKWQRIKAILRQYKSRH